MDPSSPPGERCPDAMWEICGGSEALQGAVQVMALRSASACVDVGYLCAALETADSLQLWQWPESTRRLRVRVPLPSGLAPACARELQGAVVRGIQYWQRRPFELAIDTHPTPSVEVDIEISWGEGLSGSQIGLIHTKSSLDQFEVLGITLATLSPNLRSEERRRRAHSRRPMKWVTCWDRRIVILTETSCIQPTPPAASRPATSEPWKPSTACRTEPGSEGVRRVRGSHSSRLRPYFSIFL